MKEKVPKIKRTQEQLKTRLWDVVGGRERVTDVGFHLDYLKQVIEVTAR